MSRRVCDSPARGAAPQTSAGPKLTLPPSPADAAARPRNAVRDPRGGVASASGARRGRSPDVARNARRHGAAAPGAAPGRPRARVARGRGASARAAGEKGPPHRVGRGRLARDRPAAGGGQDAGPGAAPRRRSARKHRHPRPALLAHALDERGDGQDGRPPQHPLLRRADAGRDGRAAGSRELAEREGALEHPHAGGAPLERGRVVAEPSRRAHRRRDGVGLLADGQRPARRAVAPHARGRPSRGALRASGVAPRPPRRADGGAPAPVRAPPGRGGPGERPRPGRDRQDPRADGLGPRRCHVGHAPHRVGPDGGLLRRHRPLWARVHEVPPAPAAARRRAHVRAVQRRRDVGVPVFRPPAPPAPRPRGRGHDGDPALGPRVLLGPPPPRRPPQHPGGAGRGAPAVRRARGARPAPPPGRARPRGQPLGRHADRADAVRAPGGARHAGHAARAGLRGAVRAGRDPVVGGRPR